MKGRPRPRTVMSRPRRWRAEWRSLRGRLRRPRSGSIRGAAVRLGDRLDDRQVRGRRPPPCARRRRAGTARTRAGRTRPKAAALVGDRQVEDGVAPPGGQRHRAGAVTQRVVDQVVQRLLQTQGSSVETRRVAGPTTIGAAPPRRAGRTGVPRPAGARRPRAARGGAGRPPSRCSPSNSRSSASARARRPRRDGGEQRRVSSSPGAGRRRRARARPSARSSGRAQLVAGVGDEAAFALEPPRRSGRASR